MVAAIAAMSLSGASVGAAQQGELAATSRGGVNIRASVANRALVSGVRDVALVPVYGADTASVVERLCIRSNSVTGRYDLSASGDAAGGSFVLTAADGAIVPISLFWTGGSAKGAALVPGVPVQGRASTRMDCSDASGTSLAIRAPANTTPAAGAITLTLSPL